MLSGLKTTCHVVCLSLGTHPLSSLASSFPLRWRVFSAPVSCSTCSQCVVSLLPSSDSLTGWSTVSDMVHVQYASKKTFRTVGNKRRLNGTVVLKKRSRDGVKRSTPRFQRGFSAVSARFQRVNGSTSHVARSAISTHARAQRRACPLKIKRPLACTARARRRSISGERKTATTVQFFSLCNRCRPSLLDSSIFKK